MKSNNKIKKAGAWIIIILLGSIYLCTFVFALLDAPWAITLFRASLASTILLPVMLYAFLLVYRQLKGRGDGKSSESEHKKENTHD